MFIQELLQERKLSKLKVLNQKADLSREVVTVESTETPDIASFLPSNTLLITTGMYYQNNQKALCELIKNLNELSCAGLAIKLGRFIEGLEEEVIEIADTLNFPLIQIPMNLTLGEVYKHALSILWNDKNDDLNYALNTQKKFSNLILQGSSSQAILNNLAIVLTKSVAIVSPLGELIEGTQGCSVDDVEEVQKVFKPEIFYDRDYMILEYYDSARCKNMQATIYAIKMDGWVSHWLLIFDTEDLSTAMYTLAVEQVLPILSMSLYKNFYRNYNELKLRQEFIQIAIKSSRGKLWNEQQILDMGVKYGVVVSKEYSIVLGTMYSNNSNNVFKGERIGSLSNDEKYTFAYYWLEKYLLEKYGGSILVFPLLPENRYIFIAQGQVQLQVEDMEAMHILMEKALSMQLHFSLGNAVDGLAHLQDSYEEAIEGYIGGEKDERYDYIQYYKPKSATELLKAIPYDQARKFAIENLKELAYPQDDMTLELQKTLRIYLQNNRNITETAQAMYMHRNTIKYRIKKCEQMLGKGLLDENQSFHLQLSLLLVEEDYNEIKERKENKNEI